MRRNMATRTALRVNGESRAVSLEGAVVSSKCRFSGGNNGAQIFASVYTRWKTALGFFGGGGTFGRNLRLYEQMDAPEIGSGIGSSEKRLLWR